MLWEDAAPRMGTSRPARGLAAPPAPQRTRQMPRVQAAHLEVGSIKTNLIT